MSTILKALKKSEAERELGQPPRLGPLPVEAERSGASRGHGLVVGVLGVIAVAMVVYLLWPYGGGVPQPRAQRVAQATMPLGGTRGVGDPEGKVAERQSAVGGDGTRDSGLGIRGARDPSDTAVENDIADDNGQVEREASQPPMPPPESRVPSPESRPKSRVPSPESRAKSRVPTAVPGYALLPRYRHLADARRNQIPPLTLNVLMFAEDPARRFVLINLERYRAGDRIADDLKIVEIVERGVVLEDSQGRFVLARP